MSEENPSDLNNDGQVDIEDLFIFLQNFGKVENNNIADLNGDGEVSTSDFLEFLTKFGTYT